MARTITLGHGSGGQLSRELTEKSFLPHLRSPELAKLDDAAALAVPESDLALTTDSFVVTPLVFPGSDIGRLAVYGTVNDLAMLTARPLCLSAAFIVEEGLDLEMLEQIAESMAGAARQVGVPIVTADTKVVERGSADGLFVNTTGLGAIQCTPPPSGERAQVGDRVILSGSVADHGIAVLMARNQFPFRADIASDCAPLWSLVDAMLTTGADLHALRDPTRGGLASVLNEIAEAAQVAITVDEDAVPVADPVRGACEMLGLDPFYVANEGKLVAIVPADAAHHIVAAMHDHDRGRQACIIGEVTGEHRKGRVTLATGIGGSRILDLLVGEQLPRIC
ncbi:MAG: hydrogenase expression/formation protein HypE [Armatimonadota bacterium]|jgi:hydrogenase expression/formation protein HypE